MQKKNPLVSVIIPNYNHAKYLDERIQSVLNQTYQNFEVIILDDVSTDNSKEAIEKYRNNEHVSHIVYNEVNSGSTFKQWHKGFDLAKGKLIWIAESDDSCEPTLLSTLVNELLNDEELVLAFCNSMIVDEEGNKKHIIQQKDWQKDIHESGKAFIHDYLYIDNLIYNASSAVFKKDAALHIDKQYTAYKGSGDWLFWIEICELGNISMVKQPLNYFRKHYGNVTTKMMCNGIQQIENKRIFDYLKERSLISNRAAYFHKLNNLYAYKYGIKFVDEKSRNNAIKAWSPTKLENLIVFVWHLFKASRHQINVLLFGENK